MDVRFLATPTGGPGSVAADALLVIVGGDAPSKALDGALAGLLEDVLKQGDFEVKAGRWIYVHQPNGVSVPRVAFAAAADGSPKAFRAALQTGLTAMKAQAAVKHLAVTAAGVALDASHAEALVAAANDVVYLYRHTKPSAVPPAKLAKVTLLAPKAQASALQSGLTRGAAIASGVALARELANRPGNHCTPTMLGQEAKKLGKAHGFKVEVLDGKAIDKLGMGSFAAVARGSDEPPRFIVMHHQGGAKTAKPIVLVGKGITFDSGGISLKPGAEMDEMKFDMGGAASVLGTMQAVGELKPKLNIVALIPACENMPSGRAVKPGDVVTSMSGQTIEILNTDAEGRLILCDALTYAARFKPAAIVDVATLTGAAVIALGHHHSGLYANDETLAAQMLSASKEALDPAWRMPLDDEYSEGLKSNFADVANIAGRPGGSITAAKFLQRFVGDTPWAHLDIAGTAWKGGAAKGATGRPVGLLTHFLLDRAA